MATGSSLGFRRLQQSTDERRQRENEEQEKVHRLLYTDNHSKTTDVTEHGIGTQTLKKQSFRCIPSELV
jgi:hypothetical protein